MAKTVDVDGETALLIEDQPRFPIPEPTLDEAMERVIAAQRAYDAHAAEAKLANEAKKEAQEELNAAVASAVAAYQRENDPQMALGEDE